MANGKKTATKKRAAVVTEEMLLALVADMSWQTNLNHAERERCLDWATNRFERCACQAQAEARGQLRLVNELLGRPDLDRADILTAFLGEA